MSESRISEAQLQANRENAKKSTGPTSEEGKNKSKFNATRHNLTGKVRIQTSEDMDAYYKFTTGIMIELDPVGPIEKSLAQSIADAQWRLSRGPAFEEIILSGEVRARGHKYTVNHPQAHAALAQAVAFFDRSKEFASIALYEQRLNSQLHRNLKALMEMKKNRLLRKPPEEVKVMAAASAGYESDDETDTQMESATSPGNGFVFSATPARPEHPPQDLKKAG